MTISEQIREAALYAREPVEKMPFHALACCMEMEDVFAQQKHYNSDECRTFMLLVAEALE